MPSVAQRVHLQVFCNKGRYISLIWGNYGSENSESKMKPMEAHGGGDQQIERDA